MRASALLLCNQISEDVDSHNVYVLGIFTTLKSSKFPSPYRAFSVYTLLLGAPGESANLVFRCSDLVTGTVLVEEQRRVLLGTSGKRHMQVRLELRFPTSGEYVVTLSHEEEILGEQTFLVLEKMP